MRLCTSTSIHRVYRDDPGHYTIEESLHACHEAGFRAFDVNLHTVSTPGEPLHSEDWESWIKELTAVRDALGIDFVYAHAHAYVWPVTNPRHLETHEALLERSIRAAGMLGVRWLVVHPYSIRDEAWYSHRKSLQHNINCMRKYASVAMEYTELGIAVENMVEDRAMRRFGASAEDLIELIQTLNDPIFGLCWDFGHAERSNIDQCAALRQMGDLLKAVHVHDTNADADHTLPFLGTTDWTRIMPVMEEIGYEGEWSFETPNFARFLPPEARAAALRLAYEVGQIMVQMARRSVEE